MAHFNIQPTPGPAAMIGEGIGSGFEQGFSSGLDFLMAQKLEGLKSQYRAAEQEAKQQQKMQLLEHLLGGGSFQEEGVETPQGDLFEASEMGPSDRQIAAAALFEPNLARVLQSQKKERGAEKRAAFKETKEVRKEYADLAKSARTDMDALDRMTKLIGKGDLAHPAWAKLLDKVGMDWALSPDSQEFQKLSTQFLRSLKTIFGGRISNIELEAFVKGIPTLSQSKQGKQRVIRNMRLIAEGGRARAETARDIIKENKGIPPLDIQEKVEERVSPFLDEISEKFVFGNEPEEGTLTRDMAIDYLKKARGNKKKARALARKDGFNF